MRPQDLKGFGPVGTNGGTGRRADDAVERALRARYTLGAVDEEHRMRNALEAAGFYALHQQVEDLKARLAAYEADISYETACRTIRELRARVAELERSNSALREYATQKGVERSEAVQRAERAEAALAERDAEIASLRSALSEADASLARVRNALHRISTLRDSESGEPFDEALDIADAAIEREREGKA